MSIRLIALSALTLLASGCVVEQPAPRPRPRPVVVEREPVVQRDYVEIVATQPPPVELVEREPAPRPGYIWA
ncbi:MAG TPA: hypothetical protein VFG49_09685, partial [Dyella sp.]|nr:hypothetical protein [Dyella sp.]